MKKLLNLFILILLLSILGCNNNITRAGGTLADIGKNYKANQYVRLYSEHIYQNHKIERVALLNETNLSYGEKSLILEDMFNDFLFERGYKGKRIIFKPVNGNEFCSIYSEEKGETLYIPVNAFSELPFDTLPFISMAVIQKDNYTYYYLNEKTSFIKKIKNPTSYLKNKYIYKNDLRAIDKEDISSNTNEMMLETGSKQMKINIDEIKSYLIKNVKM